jgi:hypothetical protein
MTEPALFIINYRLMSWHDFTNETVIAVADKSLAI